MPFGGYKDFAACVAANSDKNDPKAYCGSIEAAANKAFVEDVLVEVQKFVPPEAGILVDPLDVDGLADALRGAAALPRPNEAARAAATAHDVRRQAERIEAILSAAAGRRA